MSFTTIKKLQEHILGDLGEIKEHIVFIQEELIKEYRFNKAQSHLEFLQKQLSLLIDGLSKINEGEKKLSLEILKQIKW